MKNNPRSIRYLQPGKGAYVSLSCALFWAKIRTFYLRGNDHSDTQLSVRLPRSHRTFNGSDPPSVKESIDSPALQYIIRGRYRNFLASTIVEAELFKRVPTCSGTEQEMNCIHVYRQNPYPSHS